MKIKKLLSVILLTAFSAAAVPNNAFAVLPSFGNISQNETQETSESSYQFYEDFALGKVDWKCEGMNVSDGKMTSGKGFSSAKLRYDPYKNFEDITAEFGFKITIYHKEDNYFAFNCRDGSFSLLLRPTGFTYMTGGSSEQKLAEYKNEINTDYRMKVRVAGKSADVWIKKLTDADWTKISTINNVQKKRGTIGFVSYNAGVEISDVIVWNNSSDPVIMSNKRVIDDVGNQGTLTVKNNTGYDIIWKSDNEEVVKVEEDGKYTVLKGGSAVITAATSNGEFSDSAMFRAISHVSGVKFNADALERYVGERTNLTANISPYEADIKTLTWNVSDETVIEMQGMDNTQRTIKGLKPGTSTVTVTSLDGGKVAECVFTITEKPAPDTSFVKLTMDGSGFPIAENIFGMHYGGNLNTVNNAGATTPESLAQVNDVTKDAMHGMKATTLRGCLSGRWNFQTGLSTDPSLSKNKTPYTIADQMDFASENGFNQILALPMTLPEGEYPVDRLVELVVEAKKHASGKRLDIEFGNETYAISAAEQVPTVVDYVDRLKEFYKKVKEIDPDIRVAVPILDYHTWAVLAADPNNYPSDLDKNAYTQGIRATSWNSMLWANQEYFDAIVVHLYCGPGNFSALRESGLLERLAGNTYSKIPGTIVQSAQFKDKEIWITEYSDLPNYVFGGSSAEKTRQQYMKSLGNGIVYAGALMDFVKLRNVTYSNYHCLIDGQGFGVYNTADEDAVLPPYYTFGAVGKVLDENSYYYGVNLESGRAFSQSTGSGKAKRIYDIEEVRAWGFGDKNGVKKIVLQNITENPCEVSVKDIQLKPVWEYASDTPFPDFLEYSTEISYASMPSVVPQPKDLNGEFSDKVVLSPFSLTVVEVNTNTEMQLSEELRNKLERTSMACVGSNWVYGRNASRKKADFYNDSTAAYEENGRIMVPLRALGEASEAIVRYLDGNINMAFLWDSVEISLSDGTCTYEKATIPADDGIIEYSTEVLPDKAALAEKDGRVYIDAKTLANLLGKVYTEIGNGIVILSDDELELTDNDKISILNEFNR